MSENEKPEKLSVGEILKRARESQGIGLDMVHEETKIPLDALKGIEEGYTVGILSPFYRKSFTKIYANYLNVQLPEEQDEKKKVKKVEVNKASNEQIEVFDIRDWLSKVLTRRRKKQLLKLLGILLALFVLFKLLSFIIHRKPKEKVKVSDVKEGFPVEQVKERSSEVVEQTRTAVRETPVEQRTPSPESVAEEGRTSVVKIAKPVTLTVRASEKSWLRVKADGVVVFQTTLREGGVETWEAEEEIEISGRNINKLEFELNGNLIGKLGRADRKAKKVIITADGLSVIK